MPSAPGGNARPGSNHNDDLSGGDLCDRGRLSRERSKLFPDTPTVIEAGVADYDVGTWWGMVGPPGMPEPIVRTLNEAVNAIVAGEAMQKRFAEEGAETVQARPGA